MANIDFSETDPFVDFAQADPPQAPSIFEALGSALLDMVRGLPEDKKLAMGMEAKASAFRIGLDSARAKQVQNFESRPTGEIPGREATFLDYASTAARLPEAIVGGLIQQPIDFAKGAKRVAEGQVPLNSDEMFETAQVGAGLIAEGGMGAMATRAYPVGSLGMFGSRFAGKADSPILARLNAGLDRANEIISANPEMSIAEQNAVVHRESGLSKDYHGNWVFEISDENASLNALSPELQDKVRRGAATLPEVLSHPDLYEAFPYLKEVSFGKTEAGSSYVGQYDRTINKIEADPRRGGKEILETILHEVQHAVNTNEAKSGARRSLGETSDPEYINLGLRRFDRVLLNAEKKGLITKEQADHIHSFRKDIQYTHDVYEANPGETEARNVMFRREWSEAERRDVHPEKTEDLMRSDQLDLEEFQKVARKAEDAGLFPKEKEPDFEARHAEHVKGLNEKFEAIRPEPFFSGVERAVKSSSLKEGTGEQWLGTLKNAPGVKKEELETLGVEEWLKGKGKVGKGEMEEFLKGGRTEIKQVVKSSISAKNRADWGIETDNGELFLRNTSTNEKLGPFESQESIDDWLNHNLGNSETAPKFQQYQLPGGENYREVLFTLPEIKIDQTKIEPLAREIAKENGDILGPENFREYMSSARQSLENDSKLNYTTSHWSESNVLAHARLNDRVIDGKKTLFMEEVQSDWHQAGRKGGYKSEVENIKASEQVMKVKDAPESVRTELEKDAGFDLSESMNGKPFEETDIYLYKTPRGYSWSLDEAADADTLASWRTGAEVPDAPFKKTWPDLVLKNVLKEAVDKGYDQISWTSGATQAERYDLSKHIDRILYSAEDGKWFVTADKNGRAIPGIDNEPMTAKQLEDTLGKEMAEKITKGEGNAIPGGPEKELTGLDLKVGGEGMKGFYDDILPRVAEKLYKKYGGKVESSILEGTKKLTSEELIEFDTLSDKLDNNIDLSDLESSRWQELQDKDVASRKHAGTHNIHTLKITPELRAHVREGQPLFSAGVPVGDSEDE